MATWKKVIVSGSDISQLNNDSGYLVSGDSGVVLSGSFSGSFEGDGSGLTGVVATNAFALSQGTGIEAFSYDGSATATVAVSGAADLSNNAITKWDDAAGKFVDSSLIDNGTTITSLADVSIQLTGPNSSLTGSFTGSFTGNGSGLTGLVSSLSISGSTGGGSVDLLTQTLTIAGTTNEIETSAAGQTITIGLPNDVIIGNNLTVTGDFTVNGTTTIINTTDLYIEDKFILLASGSATAGDGGIIIDRGSDGAGNIGFGYDSATDRWGFQDGLVDTTNALDPTSANGVSGSFVPYLFTENDHGATKPITGEFAVQGAMYTSNAGDIWIYA